MTLIDDLKAAGLSEYDALVYRSLVSWGTQTARQVSEKSKVPITKIFEILNRLKEKGLVQVTNSDPMTWTPIKPSVGLKTFLDRKIEGYRELEERLIKEANEIKPAELEQPMQERVTVISGFDKMFSVIAHYYSEAIKTVYVYSVGEAIPTKLEIEEARAIKRGVDCRFIATSYTDENRLIFKRRKKNGVSIKYLENPADYSFAIIDKRYSFVVIKHPTAQKERILVTFDNPGLSGALQEYFESLWKKAKLLGL